MLALVACRATTDRRPFMARRTMMATDFTSDGHLILLWCDAAFINLRQCFMQSCSLALLRRWHSLSILLTMAPHLQSRTFQWQVEQQLTILPIMNKGLAPTFNAWPFTCFFQRSWQPLNSILVWPCTGFLPSYMHLSLNFSVTSTAWACGALPVSLF
jgi:hypothetical protein